MKCVDGVWLPDTENHIQKFLSANRGTYQLKTLVTALKKAKHYRVALDIGAHVGLWSMHLVKVFNAVHAFEPVSWHRECFMKNVVGATLHPIALGNINGMANLAYTSENTGMTHIDSTGPVLTEIRRLDEFAITDVDFIKIDVEGYELFVLEGALETINKYKPIMCIEQKPHSWYGLDQHAGVAFLENNGYRILERIVDDYILGPI